MCDLITGIRETHIYAYHLQVSLPPKGLHEVFDAILYELYLVCPEWRDQQSIEVTNYDQEDRQRIKDILEHYGITYHVEHYLRSQEDNEDRNL
jgi:hypothetical protein